MSQEIINNGEPMLVVRNKINDNFTDLFSGKQDILTEGEFVDGDKTKLDGIESNATADQTDAEIKTAYENNANTNAFTDSEKTNLNNQSGTNTGDQDVRVRLEGGGLVAQGTTDPTSVGANTGVDSFISGRSNDSNTGNYCSISGSSAAYNTLDYSRVHGGGTDARIIDAVAKATTTDATPTTLTLGGVAESATNRINIPTDTAWAFTATIITKDSTSSKIQMWVRQGLIYNDGGTTTLDGVSGIGADRDVGALGAAISITADDTNNALKIQGTGVAATSLKWSARVDITQVG